MSCKHRFQDELIPLQTDLKFLFIGTFNPEWDNQNENSEKWFYGRDSNLFWCIMPNALEKTSLIDRGEKEWKNFCSSNNIGITDLITEIKNADIANSEHYDLISDFKDVSLEKRDNDTKEYVFELAFNTSNIIEVIKKNKETLKGVFFTRNTLENIDRIKEQLNDIIEYCETINIFFSKIPSPSRRAPLGVRKRIELWKNQINESIYSFNTKNKLAFFIKDLPKYEERNLKLQGWVTNKRSSKGLFFIVMRDGYGFCQCVVDEKSVSPEIFEAAKQLTTESSFSITGKVVKDERQMGGYEIQATDLEVISIAEEYPISKKEHGVDFLMDERHLWLRTQRQWAIMKIRNQLIFAIHRFFQQNDFVQMDAPLFTGNAVEGTSTLFETDFYGQPAYLSQSGQLYGEAMAMAMNKIYTFGPTFRAEKSKTRRHLSEFWMMEPEMAFYDLNMNMDLIEAMLKFVVGEVVEKCKAELAIIGRDTTIFNNITKPFPRLTYDEAVKILKGETEVNGKNAVATLEDDLKTAKEKIAAITKEIEEREAKIKDGTLKKGEIAFNQNKVDNLKNDLKDLEEDERNIPIWIKSARDFRYGNDFGGSDETVITRMFDLPIMVYNWPHEVKAFYLKRDKEAPHLAKGVDVLAPEGYGEIIGGGERETDITLLKEKIMEHKLPMEAFEWYLDLRRYGSVKHAGFGLGLERLVAWVCKLPHVRETIPFPRMYGRLFP